VEITLLRHATLLVRLNGKTLLVDSMLDPPGPITMTAEDVARVCRHAPEAVVAVHVEAINHCLLGRVEPRSCLKREGLSEQTLIPADGERMCF